MHRIDFHTFDLLQLDDLFTSRVIIPSYYTGALSYNSTLLFLRHLYIVQKENLVDIGPQSAIFYEEKC